MPAAYKAPAAPVGRTPEGPPALPARPFYLKHSHQLLSGAGYDRIVGVVQDFLARSNVKSSVQAHRGRLSCHLYSDTCDWVQFKVFFFGFPSADPEGNPHFAMEFDRQQGSAFLLENVYRGCLGELHRQGVVLKG